jgi:hypothetical protein
VPLMAHCIVAEANICKASCSPSPGSVLRQELYDPLAETLCSRFSHRGDGCSLVGRWIRCFFVRVASAE